MTPAVMAEIGRGLDSHQLIKIRVFGDDRPARIAMYQEICEALDAAPIQHIGKLLVVWRPNKAAASAAPPVSAAQAPSVRRRGAAAGGRETPPSRARAAMPARERAGTAHATPRRAPRTAVRGAVPAPGAPSRARAPGESRPSQAGKGAAPRLVTIVKPTGNTRRRPMPTTVLVRGNERVTAGGNVRKAKKRPSSIKRQRQGDK